MRILTAEHIGETRVALMEGDLAVELHLERWSERGTRAVRGEVYRGRVKRIETSLNGAFIDIGTGPDGFLPFGGQGRPDSVHEGAAVGVQVAREAFQDKGPTLSLFEVEEGEAPEVVIPAPPVAERLSMFHECPVKRAKDAGVDLDAFFEEALDPVVPLPGGGRIVVEPVTALTAIDVDAAGRKSVSGGAKLAMELNKLAAREAARQIRLRGIGGVVAIDFLPLKKKADQGNLMASLKSAFRNDPAKIDIAPPSRFAIVELARQRLSRPLHEIVFERPGVETVETRALAALRALEREAASDRGARLLIRAGSAIYEWLEADPIGWRKAARHRFGDRIELKREEGFGPRAFDVKPHRD
ncbi:ribonuclease E/G [Marinicauda algicola]|uniref:ribonuclease E/G n=1 Tax=Marinicauda algicola TaxID=2029849 RepID=UPI001F133529|nr:ribonuclease E/G [Marinicauda algicola]